MDKEGMDKEGMDKEYRYIKMGDFDEEC